ncbi:MAG: GH1 family beta-glucosidase [Thermoanaerobaculia bacterium]
MSTAVFPPGFLWGAATSAFQIEGSPRADGAGASIWTRFTHIDGMVANGDRAEVACDHYHRYPEDIALMRDLGLTAYRFSISWPRIVPDGNKRVNVKGVAFYDRLVDALLEAGIEPMATLYHWDLPAALDDQGGWLNRDIAAWFSDYAEVMFRSLDDRVKLWTTINEPWVVSDGGYLHGGLAPGHRDRFEAPIASHNLLRAHGYAVTAYRALGRHQIGLVVNLEPKYAASGHDEDAAAVRRADAYTNRQFLDPVFLGTYPEELAEMYGDAWPKFESRDFKVIGPRLDFLGINYYTRGLTGNDPSQDVDRATHVRNPRATYTEMGWEVYPQGLYDALLWVKERYGDIPLYVTENGAAFYDPPLAEEDPLPDPPRVEYLHKHLEAARAAIGSGVGLRGYFVWSLLDNFEWNKGYSKRFGIVHVDFESQKRTLKHSAKFYADVIRTNGAILDQGHPHTF